MNTYSTECIDGALHVGQHHLLFHVPIGVMSTHAMGDQKSLNEQGLLHGCVDADTASKTCPEEFKEAKKKTKIIRSYETTCQITLTCGAKAKRQTWWTEVAIDREVHPKKRFNPTEEDILSSSFLELPPGYDRYAILGEPANAAAAYHLLQMTFIDGNCNMLSTTDYSNDLFNNLVERAGGKGIEAPRSGGSQGLCSFNALMKKHLRSPGIFPCHANGMLIITLNSKHKCGYFGIYSCPYKEDGKLKLYFYNTPRVGGHQKLTDIQLGKFPSLSQFPLCRVETAQLLQHRNEVVQFRKACPGAVKDMIGEFNNAVERRVSDSFKKSIGYYLAKHCRITLVAHPVGYHCDTFSRNSGDKLESKILLV
jgi:hypothetical protein